MLTEQLTETENVSQASLKLCLTRREYFWISKLDTLSPKGLNQELNNIVQRLLFTVHILLLYCS